MWGDNVDDLDFSFIGKRIKDVRTARHLTQEYMANFASVNVSHISNIENGKVKISLTLLVKVCNALGVSMDYLLQNEYQNPTTGLETEMLLMFKEMSKEKQEALIRIAKVL